MLSRLTRRRTKRLFCLLLLPLGLAAQDLAEQSLAEQSLAEQSRLAKQAMQENRFADAARLFRSLLKSFPGNTALRLNLAIALDKTGQPSAAIPEVERVTRSDPNSAPAWFLLGLAFQQLNQAANAIAPLRQAVRLDPNNSDALLELADAELTTGDTRAAIRDFTALASREPNRPKAWEGLGRAYASLSEAASRQLQNQPPRVTEPDCARSPAACAYRAGDWSSALAAASKSQSPENLYWTALASSHLAEESFNKLAAFPPSPEIHEVLADCYQRLGRRLDAIAEWRKALELDPQDPRLRARLAESLIRARIYPEAEQLLTPLVAQQPENGEWQYLLGNLLLQLKREDEALPHLIVATDRMPAFLPAQEALGRVDLALGKPADAIIRLEKARSLDDGSISFALSAAYRQLGRQQEATAALDRYRTLTHQPPR